MDKLTFHLDNVVKQKGSLTDFDGPLSLILQLLSRNRVEIQDIRISEITDQYPIFSISQPRPSWRQPRKCKRWTP